MLKTVVQGVELLTVESTASTNTDLLKDPRFQGDHPIALRALEQRAGRGRQGRPWVSAPAGLYFSIRWPFKRASHELSGLSLVIALSLTKTLEAMGYAGIAIKWPNDLYAQQKKFGGILVELGPGTPLIPAIIGVGLNVQAEPQEMDQPTTALWTFGPKIHGDVLYPRLIEGLVPDLEQFEEKGFSVFREDWERYALWMNEVIRSGHLTGPFLGVDSVGAARIGGPDGETRLFSGDVSLRADGMNQS
jgi:BirA family biotin operon repressor/biotin-[acetyl-CoA-carboxylase] ligase